MKIYEYRTAKYDRSCCYNNFSVLGYTTAALERWVACKSEIILSFVPYCALLSPHIVNNNNEIILEFCCKQPRYAIVKI